MVNSATEQPEEQQARSPGPSYQDLLDLESNPVPDSLRENTNPYLGSDNLDARVICRGISTISKSPICGPAPGRLYAVKRRSPEQVIPMSTT
jgi:hypothetical protein